MYPKTFDGSLTACADGVSISEANSLLNANTIVWFEAKLSGIDKLSF